MTRRAACPLAVAVLAGAPLSALAQQPGKVFRIGILSLAEQSSTKELDAFREGLRDLGYVDGQNITIEYRLAAGNFSRLPAMVGELVRLPVDVIVIDGGTNVAQIARVTTPTIPIVGALGPDPVAAGLAASLARPGANVTSFSGFGIELSGKRLQLLKEAFPAISRIAVLWSPSDLTLNRRATEEAAATLGVELRTIEVAAPDQIRGGFETAAAAGAEALVVLPDPMLWNERRGCPRLARNSRRCR